MSADKKKGLGRGLAALLGDDGVAALRDGTQDTSSPAAPAQTTAPSPTAQPDSLTGLRKLPVGALRANPKQPRRQFNQAAIDELAESITRHGLIQPILVRPIPGAKTDEPHYEIVAGERRWRAAQKARLHDLPVVVRSLDEEQTVAIALIENIQRQDLNPIEEAEGYQRLMDEFGHTQEEIAALVSKSRPAVANALRLLSLPSTLRTNLVVGRLSAGHARALLPLPPTMAEALCQMVMNEDLSVRETETRARQMLKGEGAKPRGGKGRIKSVSATPSSGASKSADIRAFERELAHALGLSVELETQAGSEAGALVIRYQTLEQLEDLAKKLKD